MEPRKTRPEQDQEKRPYAEPTLDKGQKLTDVAEGNVQAMSGLTIDAV